MILGGSDQRHRDTSSKDTGEIINTLQVVKQLQWQCNYESESAIPGSEILVVNHILAVILMYIQQPIPD